MTLIPKDPTLVALLGTEKTPGHDCRGPGCVSSLVTRRSYNNGQTCGEILLVHDYRDGRED
jgi:hypothetical protein